MKAMILAAGLGTRMRPLTDKTPKPLLKVGGEYLIVYHLKRLAVAGFSEIVINVSHLGEQIEQVLGSGRKYGLHISYSREEQPLESGGGVLKALPLLGSQPFLLVNGDVWCDFNFADFFLPDGYLARLLLVDNPEHNPQGDFYLESGAPLLSHPDIFRVHSSGPSQYTYTFSGISIISPELLQHVSPEDQRQGVFSLVPLLRGQMAHGQVCGHLHHGEWVDVGTPERLRLLDKQLR